MSTVERPALAEEARDLLRTRVLDAVGELLRNRSWGEVTMGAVAERAGVSRQTLYNSFGSRPELAAEYVSREADGFLAAVEVALQENSDSPRAALAAALHIFLAAAGTHPLVRALTQADGSEELLPLVTTRGGPLLEQVTTHLTGRICETWPGLDEADARPVADALVRLAISHAALPAGSPRETSAEIAGLLGPAVEALAGRAAK